jgi:hypothetical protein
MGTALIKALGHVEDGELMSSGGSRLGSHALSAADIRSLWSSFQTRQGGSRFTLSRDELTDMFNSLGSTSGSSDPNVYFDVFNEGVRIFHCVLDLD